MHNKTCYPIEKHNLPALVTFILPWFCGVKRLVSAAADACSQKKKKKRERERERERERGRERE